MFEQGIRLFPSSSYSTSMQGLTWSQVVTSPLPPYLSPIPVIFRVMAYLVIAPVLILLVLDVAGYLVWRIYDNQWMGPRTAFYKFKTSPVFARSATTSPKASKTATDGKLGSASSEVGLSPETREASLSPVSSSASLEDHYRSGLMSEQDPLRSARESRSSSSSPPSPTADLSIRPLPSHRSSSKHEDVRRRVPYDYQHDNHDGSSVIDRTDSATPNASNLVRSNSLGLGFDMEASRNDSVLSPNPELMVISPVLTPAETSPKSSGSSGLEEDDKAFNEAKAVMVN